MKSIAELSLIRERSRQWKNIRDDKYNGVRIIVRMGDCGIENGARPVLQALAGEASRENLDVQIRQIGCGGDCNLEPVIEVFAPGKEKVAYTNVTPQKAVEVLRETAHSRY